MIEIGKTEAYAKWLNGLRDVRARARILVWVERLAAGNPGGYKRRQTSEIKTALRLARNL